MRLRTINTWLLILIILINGYVIAAPLIPAVLFHWQSHNGKHQELTAVLHPKTKPSTPAGPQPNHLVIPSMLLNGQVYEGPVSRQYKTLDKGLWRWPASSTPDKGGNTVIMGHRFTYTNPRGVLYYLNKVKTGDEIGLFWDNKEYIYKVSSVNEVPPTEVSIEDNTTDARLTIFTCTPLWVPKNRLVIVAQLEGHQT